MQVGPRIRYIYLPRAPIVHNVGLPAEAKGINDKLDAMIEGTSDWSTKAKIKDIKKLLGRIMGIVQQIPSVGIRRMLMNLVGEVMDKLSKGDVDGALDLASKTLKLADDCRELCYHITNNINALRNPLYVKGPAAALLKMIGDAAQIALDSATSLGDLQELSDLTDRAVELEKKLQGLEPSSNEYKDICRELQSILSGIEAMCKDPGSDIDTMGWRGYDGPTERMRDGVAKLKNQTTDVVQKSQLQNFEEALAAALKDAEGLPGEQGDKVRKRVEALLSQAGGGDLTGALRGASELREETGRLTSLRGFLATRMKHVAKQAEALKGMPGPAGEAMERLLQKLGDARDKAATPEALMAIDNQIGRVLAAGESLLKCPAGSQMRDPGYVQLLAVERELGGPAAAEGPYGYGRDSFGGRPGKPGPKPGGPAAPTGELTGLSEATTGPVAEMRRRFGDLACMFREPGAAQDAAKRCAERGRAAMAGAADTIDLAMIALTLQVAMGQANALKGVTDPVERTARCRELDGHFVGMPGVPATPATPAAEETAGHSEGLAPPPDVVVVSPGTSAGLQPPV